MWPYGVEGVKGRIWTKGGGGDSRKMVLLFCLFLFNCISITPHHHKSWSFSLSVYHFFVMSP